MHAVRDGTGEPEPKVIEFFSSACSLQARLRPEAPTTLCSLFGGLMMGTGEHCSAAVAQDRNPKFDHSKQQKL